MDAFGAGGIILPSTNPNKVGTHDHPHDRDEETEPWKSQVTYPKSQRERGFEPGLTGALGIESGLHSTTKDSRKPSKAGQQ